MKLPFLYPLLGITLGIFIGSELFSGYGISFICFGLALLCWLLFHIIFKDPLLSFKYNKLHCIWITLLFLGIGFLDYNINSRVYSEQNIDDKYVKIKGEIIECKTLANGDIFKVLVTVLQDAEGNNIKHRNLNILVKTNGFTGNKGDVIEFIGKSVKIKAFSNKQSKYVSSLKHQGIIYQIYTESNDIRKIGEISSLFLWTSRLREKLIIKIEKSSLSHITGNFLISVLLGEKSFLPYETKETLSSAGLAHIVAVSGLHVGILLSILFFLLFPLSFFCNSNLRKIICIACLWGYVLFIGFQPSTVRAVIMATLVILSFILQRKNSGINSLLAAGFIILLFDPSSLWNIGFQLSFLCVGSILLFSDKLNKVDQHNHPKTHKFINLIIITLVTTLSTWPIIAYYFKNIPVLFIFSNLLLLPLFPVFISMGLLYIGLLCLGLDIIWLSKALVFFHDYFLDTASFLTLNGKAIISLNISVSIIFLWFIVIISIAIFIHSLKKKTKVFFASLAVVSTLFSIALMWRIEENRFESLNFRHSFTNLEAQIITDHKTHRLLFPRNSISTGEYAGNEIITIDSPIKAEFLYNFKTRNTETKKYLLVGPQADFNQIAILTELISFEKIIFHSNIGIRQIEEFIKLLDPLQIDKVHSLREMGSLEVTL